MIQIVCFRPIFAVYQIINIYLSKSRKSNILKKVNPGISEVEKSDCGSSHFRHGLDPRLVGCTTLQLLIVNPVEFDKMTYLKS